jgi:peroxiredoxin
VEVNQPAPDFQLPDLGGRLHRLKEYRGRIVLLDFWSCECPHSERTDAVILSAFEAWREEADLLVIASNRNETISAIRAAAFARRLPTVLVDADQAVADLYGAQTTPHVFLIDADGILRYRGAVDDLAFRKRRPTRFHLQEAVEALRGGRLPFLAESPAFGCAIVREV